MSNSLISLLMVCFLCRGHRIQHESNFLWTHFHSYHHQIDSPTAVSTLSIDTVDATLQGVSVMYFMYCNGGAVIVFSIV